METLHTKINRGPIQFNAPSGYEIEHKRTGTTAAMIKFQKGPVKEEGLNGVFIEDLLLIVKDQLEHFQRGEYPWKFLTRR